MNSSRRIWHIVIVLMVSVVGLQAASDRKPSEAKHKDSAAQLPGAPGVDDSYVIGPEDVLNINVWKEADMSGSVPVRPDGKITLALIGDVQASGLTPPQLTQALTGKIKKYVDDPHVTVTVMATNSRRIYVLGEVGHPGAMPLLPEMTVLQAISAAGGITPYAKAKNIYVLRNENGAQTRLPFNYKSVLAGRNPEQNIVLKLGDTIVVP
jgi:polysaccharide export outer membrane protein